MNWIINGAQGRMGQTLCHRIAETLPEITTIPIDMNGNCLHHLWDYNGNADCVLDFSHHSAAEDLASFCRQRKIPLVVATTGHTQQELACLQDAAKEIPVFLSANMSLGIALLTQLVRQSVRCFPDAEIEIVETHHDQKLDAPSGTALALANVICEERPGNRLIPGRQGHSKRAPGDIGIHALRMGNVIGNHEVHICAGNQTITLRHEAHDRSLFADGAIAAAKYLITKPVGLYSMEDMLKEVK